MVAHVVGEPFDGAPQAVAQGAFGEAFVEGHAHAQQPLVALGIGLGEAVGAAEGFGILALCSAGPILSVLATGLWIDRQQRSTTWRTT